MKRYNKGILAIMMLVLWSQTTVLAQDLPADFGDALGDNADDASVNHWYWVLILMVCFIAYLFNKRQAVAEEN
jgi:hypothetical protein